MELEDWYSRRDPKWIQEHYGQKAEDFKISQKHLRELNRRDDEDDSKPEPEELE
jgi:hypothetical protein